MSSSNESRNEQAGELEKPLGPEYVSFKNGHAYIEGHKVVKLANEVFGFDGWSSEVRSMTIDYEDERNSRYTIGVSCTMRITLKAGVYREDIGYGSSINMPHRYQAYDKARKEATTDALKRALRQFGESLGNCLYNKEYVDMVRRLKPEKTTFDIEDLRRPKKKLKKDPQPEPQPSVQATPQSTAQPAQKPAPQPVHQVVQQPLQKPVPQPTKAVQPTVFILDDDDDEDDFIGIVPSIQPRESQVSSAVHEAVFVTADHANLIQSPKNQSTPLPSDALFDTSKGSLKNSSVPQDRSMKIPRRPKT